MHSLSGIFNTIGITQRAESIENKSKLKELDAT